MGWNLSRKGSAFCLFSCFAFDECSLDSFNVLFDETVQLWVVR